ncbi:hypothetical protein ACFOQM_23370 [Paenibacillus sp. GCM10012307]|uniref:Uncharacterized protein n=1 Tax=Paenibacillus roseus TaxID=2798579 RepID=A0A934MN75_9BACL|nr:hypothetical protein [Paenibacillus roseus]MBJ6364165.1 hypothetical protein [Paenibacillus roseus]
MKYLDIAKETLAERYVLGVRGLRSDESYEVGDSLRDSFEWDMENDCSTYFTTGETAGGICCIGVDTDVETPEELAANIEAAVKQANIYGDNGCDTVIVAGRSVNTDYQTDDGEIRIRNAWVEAIIA